MMRTCFTVKCFFKIIVALSLFLPEKTKAQESESITSLFKLKWQSEIGITTYRSNILYDNNTLFLGTNGKSSSDDNDKADGVYLLNASSGKTMLQIKTVKGDADVNGIAKSGDFLFFGTDNNIFYCFTVKGKKVWEYVVNEDNSNRIGNIESCPALSDLNNDGFDDVVFTAEGKGLYALNGKNGKLLWKFEEYGEEGSYMNSPALCDMNKDGVADIVFGARGEKFRISDWDYGNALLALDGKTGNTLWNYRYTSGMKSSPHFIMKGMEAFISMNEVYSQIHFLSLRGELLKSVVFEGIGSFSGAISGLYSSAIISPSGNIAVGSSWWGEEDAIYIDRVDPGHYIKDENGFLVLDSRERIYHQTGKVSATPLVADILGIGQFQYIFCSEAGKMYITREDGVVLHQLELPEGVEASPLIKDIDLDGKLEIVVTTMQGRIFCYDTESKGLVHYGQFRANNKNTGVIDF